MTVNHGIPETHIQRKDAERDFIPYSGIYLLAHSVGRPPQNARAQAQAFFDLWEKEAEPWPLWLQGIERFRTALGELFGVDGKNFCPQTNLSSALGKVVHALPPKKGRKTLLLSEQDFPSMGFVMDRAQAMGFKLKFIPRDADHRDISVWSDYLTGDVFCALVTHVQSNTGCQVPVAEVTALTRERGIFSVVDICQSAGNIPISLDLWRADIVLGSCVKWLCGGPGAAFMWADAAVVDELTPVDVGWFSHANPMEFDIHNFEYAEGVLRFWGGTPSVLPYMVAANSVEQIQAIGVDRIRRHNLALTQSLIDAIDEPWLRSPQLPEQRGGTVIVNLGERQQPLVEGLKHAGVVFDERPNGIRLSPHIYNTREEIDALVAIVKGITG